MYQVKYQRYNEKNNFWFTFETIITEREPDLLFDEKRSKVKENKTFSLFKNL